MLDGVYIDGHWRSGRGARFSKTCPATGEVTWQGAAADGAEVAEAAASARRAFRDWSHRPQAERTRILERYADEIGKRAETIAEVISRDMGKALWDSRGEAATM